MGRDAFKSKHASSVSISGVIDTGVNSNVKSATGDISTCYIYPSTTSCLIQAKTQKKRKVFFLFSCVKQHYFISQEI
ncbi:MAG: hypothetical protein ACLUQ4_11160 [Mediterraneibacter faecis]